MGRSHQRLRWPEACNAGHETGRKVAKAVQPHEGSEADEDLGSREILPPTLSKEFPNLDSIILAAPLVTKPANSIGWT